jgi:aspartate kinase
MTHSVEKFGGVTLCWPDLCDRVMLGRRVGESRYRRIFVVSAYAGITDLLLEDKRSGRPGVFGLFRHGSSRWSEAFNVVRQRMLDINASLFPLASDRSAADAFVCKRVDAVRTILADLQHTRRASRTDEHLPSLRELLAGLGEAHSAFNTTLLLRARGVNALLVDLTDRREAHPPPLDELLQARCGGIDLTDTLPVVTGHAHCREGLVATYQRGYTEITFSRIAAVTRARHAIIHKAHHLSSADPRIVKDGRPIPIGRTNYDVADQMSLLGMEAVHPGSARILRRAGIPLRVKCVFDPDHSGTLIDADYRGDEARVEIICGRRGVLALEVFDHEMLERRDRRAAFHRAFDADGITVVASEGNANSVTHYLSCDPVWAHRLKADIERAFPNATSAARNVAVVSVIGSNLKQPRLMSACVDAMSDEGIPLLAAFQSMRGVDLKLIVNDADYERTIVCLHARLVEQKANGERRVA